MEDPKERSKKLGQEAREWLASPEGQESIDRAVQQARAIVQEEERKRERAEYLKLITQIHLMRMF